MAECIVGWLKTCLGDKIRMSIYGPDNIILSIGFACVVKLSFSFYSSVCLDLLSESGKEDFPLQNLELLLIPK